MSDDATARVFEERHFVDLENARVCYRKAGDGPVLVLVHGFPLCGLTWRKVVPELAKHFTCIAVDLLGLGDSDWRGAASISSQIQGETIRATLGALGVSSFALAGQDTGGWIAREVAFVDDRVRHLILINTEIPGHRPPWIPLHQKLALLPGSAAIFRGLLGSALFRRSGMAFGGCFADPALIEGEFADLFITPLVASQQRMNNVFRFLTGMKFARLDEFAQLHAKLRMPVALVWGADDPTFPEARARAMASAMPGFRVFHSIANARLLVHEEQPAQVARAILQFVR